MIPRVVFRKNEKSTSLLVEVSLDDIDDGPGEPPSFARSCGRDATGTLRAWQSRGGIMLDTAAVPPGLTPLVLADGARIAPQPPRWHEFA